MLELSPHLLSHPIHIPSGFLYDSYHLSQLLTEYLIDFGVLLKGAIMMNLGGTQRYPEKDVTILESLWGHVLDKL